MSIEDYAEKHEGKAHKSWVFTLNNYTEKECAFIKGLENIQRLVVGKEVGESGTMHLQGLIVWSKPKRFSNMKKLLPRAWLEKCGNIGDAANYCRKDLDMLVDLNNSKQGERSDVAKAYEAIKLGKSLKTWMTEEEPSSYQSIQVFKVAKALLAPPRPIQDIMVHWLHGDSGSGKSHVPAHIPGVYKVETFKWWDGYDDHKVVWFDEVRGDFCKFHEWLGLLDKYPFQKETKGGWVQVQFHTVYITANKCPEEMWALRGTHGEMHQREDMFQLMRRLRTISRYEKTETGNTVYMRVLENGKEVDTIVKDNVFKDCKRPRLGHVLPVTDTDTDTEVR